MTPLNGIGIHILYEAIGTDQENGDLVDFLDKARPAVVNLMGGAKLDQAFGLGKVLLARYPGMRVIFRLWPDNGRWKLTSFPDWVAMAKPFLEAGLTVLVDNESTMDNYRPYVDYCVQIMNACTPRGWKVAVGRQPTGNPGDGRSGTRWQYGDFISMYQALQDGRGLHTLSPNEYQAHDIFPGKSDGNTARYLNHEDEALKHDILIPSIDIGEYGIAQNKGYLDPGHGWQDCGWDGYAYGKSIVANWKAFYQPRGVPVSIYAWGDSLSHEWKSFRIDKDKNVLRAITDAAEAGELAIQPRLLPPVVVTPSSPTKLMRTVRLPRGNTYVNLRRGPSTTHVILGVLREGDVLEEIGRVKDNYQVIWLRVRFQNLEGYVSTQGPEGHSRVNFT